MEQGCSLLRAPGEVQGRELCSSQTSPRQCIPLARNDSFSFQRPLPDASFEAAWQLKLAPGPVSPAPIDAAQQHPA